MHDGQQKIKRQAVLFNVGGPDVAYSNLRRSNPKPKSFSLLPTPALQMIMRTKARLERSWYRDGWIMTNSYVVVCDTRAYKSKKRNRHVTERAFDTLTSLYNKFKASIEKKTDTFPYLESYLALRKNLSSHVPHHLDDAFIRAELEESRGSQAFRALAPLVSRKSYRCFGANNMSFS